MFCVSRRDIFMENRGPVLKLLRPYPRQQGLQAEIHHQVLAVIDLAEIGNDPFQNHLAHLGGDGGKKDQILADAVPCEHITAPQRTADGFFQMIHGFI